MVRGYPSTSDRSRGWLRYLYRKATTPDNWDNITGAPMRSWHRMDLVQSSFAMAVMADRTPAWREIHGHILDELISRYTGYWSPKDWLDQIGDDPRREQYPEAWYENLIPPFLRGGRKNNIPCCQRRGGALRGRNRRRAFRRLARGRRRARNLDHRRQARPRRPLQLTASSGERRDGQ